MKEKWGISLKYNLQGSRLKIAVNKVKVYEGEVGYQSLVQPTGRLKITVSKVKVNEGEVGHQSQV